LKDSFASLIDFLSQIAKLSYFTLLDVADFFEALLVSRLFFLMWQATLGVC